MTVATKDRILLKLKTMKLRVSTMDAWPKDPDPKNWRTIEGTHVHLKNGKIDGGAGGKFNGNIWSGKQKHNFIGPQTFAQFGNVNWKVANAVQKKKKQEMKELQKKNNTEREEEEKKKKLLRKKGVTPQIESFIGKIKNVFGKEKLNTVEAFAKEQHLSPIQKTMLLCETDSSWRWGNDPQKAIEKIGPHIAKALIDPKKKIERAKANLIKATNGEDPNRIEKVAVDLMKTGLIGIRDRSLIISKARDIWDRLMINGDFIREEDKEELRKIVDECTSPMLDEQRWKEHPEAMELILANGGANPSKFTEFFNEWASRHGVNNKMMDILDAVRGFKGNGETLDETIEEVEEAMGLDDSKAVASIKSLKPSSAKILSRNDPFLLTSQAEHDMMSHEKFADTTKREFADLSNLHNKGLTARDKSISKGIHGYVGNGTSYLINSNLRAGKLPPKTAEHWGGREYPRKIVVKMDEATSKFQLDKNRFLYRNVKENFVSANFPGKNINDLIEEIKNGKTIIFTDSGFTSTSLIADKNVFQDYPIHFKIKALKGTTCYVTDNPEESETVLPRGTTMRINKIEEKTVDGELNYFCDLEIVGGIKNEKQL